MWGFIKINFLHHYVNNIVFSSTQHSIIQVPNCFTIFYCNEIVEFDLYIHNLSWNKVYWLSWYKHTNNWEYCCSWFSICGVSKEAAVRKTLWDTIKHYESLGDPISKHWWQDDYEWSVTSDNSLCTMSWLQLLVLAQLPCILGLYQKLSITFTNGNTKRELFQPSFHAVEMRHSLTSLDLRLHY